MMDLRTIARALGGEITHGAVLAPGPGHSRQDRSLSIKPSWQAPDGFLVFSHAGDDFRVCRDYVAEKLGITEDRTRRREASTAPTPGRSDASTSDAATRIARAVAIWNEAHNPHGTIVETYLSARGLDLVSNINEVLRFHPRCPWRDEATDRTIYVPALVAAMRQIEGDRITAVHRTRLTPDGQKVDRRMLGIAAGAAVKLDADADVTHGLHVAEGIETGLAARQLGLRPVWAIGSAGAVGTFPILAGIECLTLLAEHDRANAAAVEVCAQRWAEASREVHIVRSTRGNDLNDAIKPEAA